MFSIFHITEKLSSLFFNALKNVTAKIDIMVVTGVGPCYPIDIHEISFKISVGP